MDQIKYQNIASSLAQSIKSHQNVLKITQVLVSISVCSFIFSPSSLQVFLHYFKFYLSTLPFQLFTHNIDKNSMFLLCNGLLVFVGITRSFSAGSRDHHNQDQDQDSNGDKYCEEVEEEEVMMMMEEKSIIDEHNIVVAEDDDEEELETKQYCDDDDNIVEQIIVVDDEENHDDDEEDELEEEKEIHEEENNEVVFDAEQEDDQNVLESDDQFLSEENFEEEEESNMISTEELNKKFEDFIRRMKQDLRIEAQRQLVMV